MGQRLACGIIGLPNVGKSTLFNALLKKRVALSANYPFATVEPNVGIVAVPDSRLDQLSQLVSEEEKMTSPPPIVPAVVEFVDIAGLVRGASVGEGLGNQFLSHIREVDAIVEVVRDFSDEGIVRAGSVSPAEDIKTIETELILADLQTIDKLILASEKEIKFSQDPLDRQKLEILKKIKGELDQGRTLARWADGMVEEKLQGWFIKLPLLATKPVLYVYNVSEASISSSAYNVAEDNDMLAICAKLEEELVDLSEEERRNYLLELGIEETGLERLIKKAYQILGLISYLTAGKKEVRAWTIKEDSFAPTAAGVIHSDFEKNFIRAQVISYEKLIEAGSYGEAKKLGWIATVGKDYIIRDGDVIEFLIGS